MKDTHFIVDRFYPEARGLREVFEERFRDPRESRSDRFVWDYWHVPDQYTLIRTPAYHYFPKKMYESFHRHLVQWGQENLGCADITPPWMSYYIDGCSQGFHADVPHGPWAYVFSLTLSGRKGEAFGFKGGETMILRPEVLDYWSGFQEGRDVEQKELLLKIPALFNRLVVFDPRLPHGVSPVEGTRDPLQARLVIHGWFTQPRPFSTGALSPSQVAKTLNPALEELSAALGSLGRTHGTVTVRLAVNASGKVTSLDFLTQTLVSLDHAPGIDRRAAQLIRAGLSKLVFAKTQRKPGATRITVPFLFR